MRSRAAVALLAALAVSCGARLMKLPSGPGAAISAGDAAALLAGATAACGGIRDLSAEVGVSGRAAGQRLRGRLLVGLGLPASARVEAVAPFGQPVFIFASAGGNATLLLPRDRRVLRNANPRDALDAIAGIPLDVSDLWMTLTGCPGDSSGATGVAHGDDWRVVTTAGGGSKTIYLRRENTAAAWRIAAIQPDEADWRTEYLEHQNGLPRSVRVASLSQSAGAAGFNITLTLTQVDTNASLGPEVFSIQIPPDVQPITLEELRRGGPLAP
jgi:hypothetical protein